MDLGIQASYQGLVPECAAAASCEEATEEAALGAVVSQVADNLVIRLGLTLQTPRMTPPASIPVLIPSTEISFIAAGPLASNESALTWKPSQRSGLMLVSALRVFSAWDKIIMRNSGLPRYDRSHM